MEVLHYCTLNKVEISNRILFDFYYELHVRTAHTFPDKDRTKTRNGNGLKNGSIKLTSLGTRLKIL